MIYVTRTYLPPLEEYTKLLEEVWASGFVTNNAPLLQRLEREVAAHLGLNSMAIVSSGTLALVLAMRALDLRGEVITTPFSYVATAAAVCWERATPVFADIDPNTFCIDPREIERRITSCTTGIVATHVFGNMCDVEAIKALADKHHLHVIYDAAHSFGVRYKQRPAFAYGDISATSFHATKLFHMVEGGALATSSEELMERLRWMRNFGHDNRGGITGLGINGKNSEFHAAIGLTVLRRVDSLIAQRTQVANIYDGVLQDAPVQFQRIESDMEYNYAYYPVVFESAKVREKVESELLRNGIAARRYFSPSLNLLPYVKAASCPVAERIANTILCLPLHHELTLEDADWIARLIRDQIA